MVEEARTFLDEDDPAKILSSSEVAQTVEKTVTLVGQVINLITYKRKKMCLRLPQGKTHHKQQQS